MDMPNKMITFTILYEFHVIFVDKNVIKNNKEKKKKYSRDKTSK